MFITASQLKNKDITVGTKAIRLSELKDIGYNVPDFVVIPGEQIIKIINKSGKIDRAKLKELTDKVTNDFYQDQYAIRSSAIIEDGSQESMAGQFKTVLAVETNELSEAIAKVLKSAVGILGSDTQKFAIIIQKFIQGDLAGVAFTRDPKGSRDMVIEYVKGTGEKLVNGKTKPMKIQFFWTSNPKVKKFPKSRQTVTSFKAIEKYYNQPQDIEWCIKNKILYLLQTRPITTIKSKQYEQILYLDKKLPKSKKYFYAKTEISEIAPRPSTLTFDILKSLFQSGGPVSRVYFKYSVSYQSYNFLLVIGNELYSDREKEMKTLFPERSIISSSFPSLPPADFNSLFRTVKNQFFFRNITVDDLATIKDELEKRINRPPGEQATVKDLLKQFKEDYKQVYNINLLTGVAVNKLETHAQKEGVQISTLLGSIETTLDKKTILTIKTPNKKLIGNSLELLDETPFVGITEPSQESNESIVKWWQGLSGSKKKLLEPLIYQVANCIRLREYGRFLVVKNINELRGLLYEIARRINLKDKRSIFFVRLSELLSGHIYEKVLCERQEEYQEYQKFNLPRVISSRLDIPDSGYSQGVSPGKAKGIMVTEEEIKNSKYLGQDMILYTKMLNPNLVKHFDKIKGIVSENGSLLSHLAILARERKVPVVVNFVLEKENILLDDKVSIDGTNGNVKKLVI